MPPRYQLVVESEDLITIRLGLPGGALEVAEILLARAAAFIERELLVKRLREESLKGIAIARELPRPRPS